MANEKNKKIHDTSAESAFEDALFDEQSTNKSKNSDAAIDWSRLDEESDVIFAENDGKGKKNNKKSSETEDAPAVDDGDLDDFGDLSGLAESIGDDTEDNYAADEAAEFELLDIFGEGEEISDISDDAPEEYSESAEESPIELLEEMFEEFEESEDIEETDEIEEYLSEAEEQNKPAKAVDTLAPQYLIRLVIVLTSICAAIALLLAVVNSVTKDVIAENQEKAQQEAILAVFPEGDQVEEFTAESGETVYIVLKNGEIIGYTVSATGSGYVGPVDMMIGMTADGAVDGIKIVTIGETPGVGTKISAQSFLDSFIGFDRPITLGEDVDAVSGATFSSRAVEEAVNYAVSLEVDLAKAAAELDVIYSGSSDDYEDKKDANDDNGDAQIDIGEATAEGEESTADTDLPETEPDETDETETAESESETETETEEIETSAPETLPPETIPAVVEPVIPPETEPIPETLPPETLPPETEPVAETLPPETEPVPETEPTPETEPAPETAETATEATETAETAESAETEPVESTETTESDTTDEGEPLDPTEETGEQTDPEEETEQVTVEVDIIEGSEDTDESDETEDTDETDESDESEETESDESETEETKKSQMSGFIWS